MPSCRKGREGCLIWEGSLSSLHEMEGKLPYLGREPFLPVGKGEAAFSEKGAFPTCRERGAGLIWEGSLSYL